MKTPQGLVEYGWSVLRTTVDAVTSVVIAQLGDILTERVHDDNAEWWQHVGFSSRPAPPEAKKKAAQTLSLRGPSAARIFASRDLRGLPPDLADGETCVYSAANDGTIAARVTARSGGRIEVLTKADGSGANVVLDPSDDSMKLTNAAGFGITIDKNGITMTGPGGSQLQLAASGATLQSDGTLAVNGAVIQLGGSSASKPALGGPSGMAGLPSTKVFVAP